jgi:TRAP-type C4-dicarboxylate transport system permease small subunit
MANQKIIGIVLLVVGLILLYFGWQSSQSVGEQLSEAFTGRFTDDTLLLLIGGAAAVVAGAFMAFFRK